MLSTLDNKIQAISTQAAASKQRLEEHDQIVQQNLKELMEKQKEKGVLQQRRGFPAEKDSMRMDVDEPADNSKGKNKK